MTLFRESDEVGVVAVDFELLWFDSRNKFLMGVRS